MKTEPPAGKRTICVIGMPRSGTSLAARLLNIMGVDLGPPEHMLEPSAVSNPKGYWEQREINALNDAVLETFGGTLETPPELPPGWETDPRLDALKEQARRLLQDYFGDARLWGWKDPRNSLTQPFWTGLTPEPAFVICVRAPGDAAASWQKHGTVAALDRDDLLRLWLRYNSAALEASSGAQRVIVFQDRLLASPEEEVGRLARFLAALHEPPSADEEAAAIAFIDADLVHHRTSVHDAITDETVPLEARALYAVLRSLAGLEPGSTAEADEAVDALAAALWHGYREREMQAGSPSGTRDAATGAVATSELRPRRAHWLRRLARRARALRERRPSPPAPVASAEPSASLDSPEVGAVRSRNDLWVWGRVLFPAAATARVLVSVGGAPPVRARLAVPRPDVADEPALSLGHRDASHCGFELLVSPRALPRDGREVQIEVEAVAIDGRRLQFPSRTVRVEAPIRGTDQDDARAASLRRRVRAGPTPADRREHPGAIAVVAPDLARRGVRETLLEQVRRLAAEGFELRVVSTMNRPLRDRFVAAGADVHMGPGFPLESPELYEARLSEFAAWTSLHGPHGILACGIESFPAVDLAQRLGLGTVWLLPETLDLDVLWIRHHVAGPEFEYARQRAAIALRGCSAAIFPSQASCAAYGGCVEDQRALIVPPPIDTRAIEGFRAGFDRAQARWAVGLPSEAIVIFCPNGQSGLMVQALAELRKRHPNARLVLRAPAEAQEEVESYARDADLLAFVRVLPDGYDYHWYCLADVVVVDDDPEDLPRACLEAMACGAQVVTSAAAGATEIVDDGVHGWVWPENDLGDLVDRLGRALAAGPDERREMSASALARVKERHPPGAFVDALGGLFTAPICSTGDAGPRNAP